MESESTVLPRVPEMSRQQVEFVQKNVLQHEHNSVCADCGKNESKVLNLTYGTFHCNECADDHRRNFHVTTSHLHNVSESWDQYALLACLRGGNKRWADLCAKYKFSPQERQIHLMYKTDVSMYYRKWLRAQMYGYEFNANEPDATLGQKVDSVLKAFSNGLKKIDQSLTAKPKPEAEKENNVPEGMSQ